ncbi:MAG: cohesin domain-containing protein, partial [Bryobacteraceae bacterium]
MKTSLLLSAFLLAGTTGAFGYSISVSPASQDVSVGQTFAVDVDIDQIQNVGAFQFSLSFDPQILSAQSVTAGPLLPDGTTFFPGTIDNNTGSIAQVTGLLGALTTGSGQTVLATVQFAALGAGTSPINLSDLELLVSPGEAVVPTGVPGAVDVASTAVPEAATPLLVALGLFVIA